MFCLERVLLSFAFLPDTIDCFIPVNGEKATTLFFSKARDRARTLLVDGDAGNHGLLCFEVFVQDGKNKRTKICSAIFCSSVLLLLGIYEGSYLFGSWLGFYGWKYHLSWCVNDALRFRTDTLFAQFPLSVEECGFSSGWWEILMLWGRLVCVRWYRLNGRWLWGSPI